MKEFLIFILMMLVALSALSSSVLFDAGHGQTVGNADWTITGAYSDFGMAISRFFVVKQTYKRLTYSILKNYSVLVIPEPNDSFTPMEEEAIVQFIESGGGVFFIADHEGADRNQNGWDAISIFNDFVKPLGFEFMQNSMTEYPAQYVLKSPITDGVKKVGEWAGSTLKVLSSSSVHPAIELYTCQPYVVYGNYGKGRFVAVGDSSPFDDGTGSKWKSLYDGWKTGDDSVLAVNSVYWLATGKATDTSMYLIPPMVERVIVKSAYEIVIKFNKRIVPPVMLKLNLNVTRANVKSTEVKGNDLIVWLSKKLEKGKHTLITRLIKDEYGNVSPMEATIFRY